LLGGVATWSGSNVGINRNFGPLIDEVSTDLGLLPSLDVTSVDKNFPFLIFFLAGDDVSKAVTNEFLLVGGKAA
jgi:hypothetical protein